MLMCLNPRLPQRYTPPATDLMLCLGENDEAQYLLEES